MKRVRRESGRERVGEKVSEKVSEKVGEKDREGREAPKGQMACLAE